MAIPTALILLLRAKMKTAHAVYIRDNERERLTKEKKEKKKKRNQSPKGIMRSAVPLPCFFEVTMSQKVVGQ